MTEVTIPEFAALCRGKCPNPAQGYDAEPCGAEHEYDGETSYAFCGHHWAIVMGASE